MRHDLGDVEKNLLAVEQRALQIGRVVSASPAIEANAAALLPIMTPWRLF